MPSHRRRCLTLGLGLGLGLGVGARTALAAGYPSRAVTLIVPFSPGGGNDTVARVIAQTLAPALGQPVIVDNKPGSGGSLGAEIAARAAPDGHTLFLGGVGSHALNPSVQPRLRYDPLKDFTPIVWIASAPMVLAVHPSVQATGVRQLIELARRQPGRLNVASNGNGSSSHLAAVMFASMAGIELTHVPYKGLSPALVDLLSGTVQLMFSSTVAILPSVQAGKLRVLAVTGEKRLASLPQVPTVAEEGLAGYATGSWYGILGPAGLAQEVVARLNGEINKALQNPEVRARLAQDGAEPVGGTPQAFADHIRSELRRIAPLARSIPVE